MKIKTLFTVVLLLAGIFGHSQISPIISKDIIELQKKQERHTEILGEIDGKLYMLSIKRAKNLNHPVINVFDTEMILVRKKEVLLPKDFEYRTIEIINNEIYIFLSNRGDKKKKRNIYYQKLDLETIKLTGDLISIGSIPLKNKYHYYKYKLFKKTEKSKNDRQLVIMFYDSDGKDEGIYACIEDGELIANGNYKMPGDDFDLLLTTDLKITEFPKFAAIFRATAKKSFNKLTFYLGKLDEDFIVEEIKSEPGLEMEDFCIMDTDESNFMLVGVTKQKVKKQYSELRNLITYEFIDSELEKIDETELISKISDWNPTKRPHVGVFGELYSIDDDFNLYIGKVVRVQSMSHPRSTEAGAYVLELGVAGNVLIGMDSLGNILWNEYTEVFPRYSIQRKPNINPFGLVEKDGKIFYLRNNASRDNIKGELFELSKDGILSKQTIEVKESEINSKLDINMGIVQIDNFVYGMFYDFDAQNYFLCKIPL